MILIPLNLFYSIIFILILFFISLFLKILDIKGSLISLAIGLDISIFGNFFMLFLLIIFVMVSFIFTRFRIEEKADGRNYTRSYQSVLSKGIVPALIVIFPINVIEKETLFSVAVAAALSDTMAGEIGILSRDTFSIINFKKINRGENGGISLIGEIAALTGSFIIAIFSLFFFNIDPYFFTIILIMGFLSSNIDSLLGGLFENRGILNKHEVNIISISLSLFIAFTLI
ncbi:MAG: DUF92 domain-containing protein [Thermoplasmata archaeon]